MVHFYKTASDIDSSLSTSSSLADVAAKMPNGSVFMASNSQIDTATGFDTAPPDNAMSIIVMFRPAGNRVFAIGVRSFGNINETNSRLFFATYDGSKMLGWFEIAKADASTTSALNSEIQHDAEEDA